MKKKIPLAILEVLQPIIDKNLDLVQPIKFEEGIFHLVDNDESSDFYFKVLRQEASNNKSGYVIEYKPTSKDNVKSVAHWTELNKINDYITEWLKIIGSYNAIQTIYDDPIIKSNQERIEREFNLVDDDAKTSSFDLKQLLFLEDYLETAKSKLLTLKEDADEATKIEIEELEIEATKIKADLTKQTKYQIFKRLTKFWAKAQKTGLEVIKELFISVTTELTKQLLLGGQ
jgi:hypothetical protein